MAFEKIIAAVALVMAILRTGQAAPVPDSAGIVPMPPGLAYGGIPYGSTSGALAHYAPAQAYYPQDGPQESALVATDTGTIPIVSPLVY
ncbi:uncharacterized protein LOC131666847 [Phymastichus coffea]|uniref:uncharacterized protein LOC131666847 n=1 Tax=Phymastichus coffea TaxID=108790 RepID=UPI00273BDD68|nr:uncharacterized protein LOC131666847 [Phymastichus coffea]